jgi:hypothetical protein
MASFSAVSNTIKNDYLRRTRVTQSEILPTAVKSSHWAQENIITSAEEQIFNTVPAGVAAQAISKITAPAGSNINLSSYHIMAWQGTTTLSNIIPSGLLVNPRNWCVTGPFVVPYISYPYDNEPDFGSSANRLVIRTWFTNLSAGPLTLTIRVRIKYFVATGEKVGVT